MLLFYLSSWERSRGTCTSSTTTEGVGQSQKKSIVRIRKHPKKLPEVQQNNPNNLGSFPN